MKEPLFTVLGNAISGRDLVLILGGLSLLGESTLEIHHQVEGDRSENDARRTIPTVAAVLLQIALLDLVFSLDSVITAVGMADDHGVMVSSR